MIWLGERLAIMFMTLRRSSLPFTTYLNDLINEFDRVFEKGLRAGIHSQEPTSHIRIFVQDHLEWLSQFLELAPARQHL